MIRGKLIFILILIHSHLALAVLGDSESDLVARLPRSKFQKSTLSTGGQNLDYFIYDANGTQTKEYLDPVTKKVFAVTWTGSHPVDMSALSGSYANELPNVAINSEVNTTQDSRTGARKGRARGPTTAYHTDNLTVVSFKRARFSTGKIIINAQIPQGLSAENIK